MKMLYSYLVTSTTQSGESSCLDAGTTPGWLIPAICVSLIAIVVLGGSFWYAWKHRDRICVSTTPNTNKEELLPVSPPDVLENGDGEEEGGAGEGYHGNRGRRISNVDSSNLDSILQGLQGAEDECELDAIQESENQEEAGMLEGEDLPAEDEVVVKGVEDMTGSDIDGQIEEEEEVTIGKEDREEGEDEEGNKGEHEEVKEVEDDGRSIEEIEGENEGKKGGIDEEEERGEDQEEMIEEPREENKGEGDTAEELISDKLSLSAVDQEIGGTIVEVKEDDSVVKSSEVNGVVMTTEASEPEKVPETETGENCIEPVPVEEMEVKTDVEATEEKEVDSEAMALGSGTNHDTSENVENETEVASTNSEEQENDPTETVIIEGNDYEDSHTTEKEEQLEESLTMESEPTEGNKTGPISTAEPEIEEGDTARKESVSDTDGQEEALDGQEEVLDGQEEVLGGQEEALDGLEEVLDGQEEVLDGQEEVLDERTVLAALADSLRGTEVDSDDDWESDYKSDPSDSESVKNSESEDGIFVRRAESGTKRSEDSKSDTEKEDGEAANYSEEEDSREIPADWND